ncbi:response regulator transcription factor [Novosphingobium gossypii]|uniref:response regulator transcription factor n=1 Tax=Novosphingobium gossypii TaxID=1604774 RepID=UPI003D19934A
MEAQFILSEVIVHIVDDDEGVREALEDLFLSVGLQARTYATALEFLDQADPVSPGCLLCDVRLPQLGGLELQVRLSAHGFLLPVVFMSGYADIPMAVRGLKAGAKDFLLKPLRDQEVLDAANAAIEFDNLARSAALEGGQVRLKFATLTCREKQVASLVLSGRKNREIADALSLSEITVKIHRSNAMHKLGAHNVQHLVRMDRLINFAISNTTPHFQVHQA